MSGCRGADPRWNRNAAVIRMRSVLPRERVRINCSEDFGSSQRKRDRFFGFHIHQGDNCSGTDFSGTGSHYNPSDQAHPKHAGDLPPLLECQGNAYLSVRTDRFSVADIIGRTVVIHSDPDDFHSQPAGNAGRRLPAA